MDDLNNALVLAIFASSVIAVIAGYLLAWRAKRAASRRVGSSVTAVVAGFAGLFMLAWLLGAIMPFPPPDGRPLWGPLLVPLIFSPLPLGAFYICAKFIRHAHRDERK
jgi:ABC-type Co2+ transport system permease subunit